MAQGVTNEMLKLIPLFREREERMLICTTNSVGDLDTAFWHGRPDYLIPVGPPDDQAGGAIWDRWENMTRSNSSWAVRRAKPGAPCPRRWPLNSGKDIQDSRL